LIYQFSYLRVSAVPKRAKPATARSRGSGGAHVRPGSG